MTDRKEVFMKLANCYKVGDDRYKVRAVAYVLNVTPALIYSFFKDRGWDVNGGLTETQVLAVARHVEENKNRPKPYKVTAEEVSNVQAILQARPNTQQMLPIGEDGTLAV